MKRILFVSLANLYLCPYIQKYIDAFNGNVDYDIVYWDRHNVEDGDYGAKRTYVFKRDMEDFVSKSIKLIGMMKFCHYAKKIMRKNQYDGIVFLHTNAAILMSGFLMRNYKEKYIYDIRDYSYEHIPIFYRIEKKLIKHSAISFISSDGFRKFLPEHDYHLVHNNVKIPQDFVKRFRETHMGHQPIRISFVGMVRFMEQGKMLANCLGNDSRYLVNYFGKNANVMQQAIGETSNHTYVDQFPPEKTLEFYEETDMINNVYGNQNPYVDYLASNKLYYSTILGIPILVSANTYMAELVQKYQIGFVFDEHDPEIADKLYEYYCHINWEEFHQACDSFCRMVEKDDLNFEQVIRKFVS